MPRGIAIAKSLAAHVLVVAVVWFGLPFFGLVWSGLV